MVKIEIAEPALLPQVFPVQAGIVGYGVRVVRVLSNAEGQEVRRTDYVGVGCTPDEARQRGQELAALLNGQG